MADWIVKLDDFLKLSEREILTHPGNVSHDEALRKAHDEFVRYRHAILGETSQVERDFLEAAKRIEKSGKHP